MKKSLEQHKTFPVIAWILVVSFVLLVFYLIDLLQSEAEQLDESRTSVEGALHQDLRYEDFEY